MPSYRLRLDRRCGSRAPLRVSSAGPTAHDPRDSMRDRAGEFLSGELQGREHSHNGCGAVFWRRFRRTSVAGDHDAGLAETLFCRPISRLMVPLLLLSRVTRLESKRAKRWPLIEPPSWHGRPWRE